MKTKKKLLIGMPIILLLLVTMTISDNYYSDLEEQYPILEKTEQMEGKVTGLIIHHKYIYLELDGQTKRLVPPSLLKNADRSYLHKAITIGDHFMHAPNSEEVALRKDDDHLRFVVAGFVDI
jgi:heme/copper-type cytochrome/quinol oxidase subunit 2